MQRLIRAHSFRNSVPRVARKLAQLPTLLAGLLAALATGCMTDSTPLDPTKINATVSVNAGDAQLAVVGQAVPIAPSVLVKRNGSPAANVTITFSVVGNGSVTPSNVLSDANGIARVTSWTLNNVAGPNVLKALVAGSDTAFVLINAVGLPSTPVAITKFAGDAQIAPVSTLLPIRPAVKVADQFGNGVPGITVNFTATAGSGVVGGTSQVTGADGVASVSVWTLGQTAGQQSITASAAAISTQLVFTATALPGAAASLTKIVGDAQTGTVAQSVAIKPSVKVVDQFGNAVSGVAVTLDRTSVV